MEYIKQSTIKKYSHSHEKNILVPKNKRNSIRQEEKTI